MLTVTAKAWGKPSGISPTEEELRQFLRLVHVEVYDFGRGQRHEREAESDLRSHIVADTKQAGQAWKKLEHIFGDADRRGIGFTPALLRKLGRGWLALKSPPGLTKTFSNCVN